MQRRLLGRDMKMTRSETKRERKDIDGNPLIKRTAAQIARKAVPGDSVSYASFQAVADGRVVARLI
ncbi:EscU/YscU/HrcU family type III secretion system export apparatus switch protein [Pseudomonas sp. ArH3a]|nr:EscU/YscU/HrcU family type III secretion system export apparatus switch protein [Pseudomonas sp. ArH3a]